MACLQRCLVSLPPDVLVFNLVLSVVCLPSSPPPSDHSPVSLSTSAGPKSELRWEECVCFWLHTIPLKERGLLPGGCHRGNHAFNLRPKT